MSITLKLEEAELDFILATLNGQPANWTVMARAALIQKLMSQVPKIEPPAGDTAVGGTDD